MRLDRKATEALADTLHLACFSGGSGRGMHFWADAAKCGMRALLNESRRTELLTDSAAIPATPGPESSQKNALEVGSGYHKLHELFRTAGSGFEMGQQPGLEVEPGVLGASATEALRLFNGWVSHWPMNLWGRTVAVEQVVRNAALFGTEVTAMPDLVTEVRAADLPAIQARCPEVIEPGYYIIDFKTSDQPYHELYYKGGMQALWYPQAWNRAETNEVKGVIFDVIYKFGRRKNQTVTLQNFGAVFAEAPEEDAYESLKGLIKQGKRNLEMAQNGYGNRSECLGFSFSGVKLCQFYGHGCPNGKI